jgi:phosphate transport system protein
MQEHIAKAFDIDLQELTRNIAELGGLAEKQVADAAEAIASRDIQLAERVVIGDAVLDSLQRQIEEKAILTIARRQPMAVDLRQIIGALRVSNDLERVGDLAKNNSKRVLELIGDFHPQKLIRGVEHMNTLALAQLKQVIDAYVGRDIAKAHEVWNSDQQIDALCVSVFRELLTYMMEDPRNIGICIHLMFCAKNIERIGDHTTNIAESVHYIIEGQPLVDERPKSDTTRFAGQMAQR